jgi:16S rRNA (adenine1518-N6/adenine1519-N6)-dimethyltransferase
VTPSELLSFLASIGRQPNKRLSQNFLIDGNIVRKIIRTAGVVSGEEVVEIGSGPGALTQELLDMGAHVIAVEKDPVLAHHLLRFQTPDNRLRVHCVDILDFPLPPHIKVVANLPYHITTPILEKVLTHPFSSLTLMMQKEVAARLLASPGCKEFGSLTLFLQFHGTIVDHFSVGPNSFYPQPSVDSSVLRIDSHPTPLPDSSALFRIIRRAFQQRRKMLSSSLKEFDTSENIRAHLRSLGIREDARPEMLSLAEWLRFGEKYL